MWRMGWNNKCKPLSAKFFSLRERGGASNLSLKKFQITVKLRCSKQNIAFKDALRQIDIHEYVHVFKQHAFMKLKRKWILERLLYGFCLEIGFQLQWMKWKNYEI